MKKKSDQLDYIVREKLSQLHVEYQPQHWTQFEQLLEQREAGVPVADDRRLDETVFAKMHQFQADGRAAHWDQLATRLNEQVDVRQKLVLYKLMEASLVLLLLFVVLQNFPLYSEDTTKTELPSSAPIAATSENKDQHQNKNFNASSLPAAQAKIVTTDSFSSEKNLAHQKKSTPSSDPTVAATTPATLTAPSSASPYEMRHTIVSPHLSTSRLQSSNIKIQAPTLNDALTESSESHSPAAPERLELMSALEQLMLAELEYDAQPGYISLAKPIRPRRGWVVGMFGSGEYNRVTTPPVVINEDYYESILRYAPGYGGGITAGLEIGRWEIGGGAAYSAKKYQPRPVIRLGGSFFDNSYDGEALRYIELNMVQVPLYFRYNFIHHDKWRAYATVGVSLHVNFETNYYFTDDKDFPQFRGLLPSERDYTPERPSDLPGGWFDGGSLWQNGYLSGNVSLGVERYITGRWSLFVQPTYHQSLNYFTQGIGPDKDRINTMSIFTGVRVRLNP